MVSFRVDPDSSPTDISSNDTLPTAQFCRLTRSDNLSANCRNPAVASELPDYGKKFKLMKFDMLERVNENDADCHENN